MEYLKFLFAKYWAWCILAADDNTVLTSRFVYFSFLLLVTSPVTIIFQILVDWYIDQQAFVHGNALLIVLNTILGGWFHFRVKRDFKWEQLLLKTLKVAGLSVIVYLVLEIIISRGGDYGAITAFRAALQVGTLLYPGTKILKHVYILSKGEYPPTWIMTKVYNFEKDGDLNEFFAPVTPPAEDDFNQKFPGDE